MVKRHLKKDIFILIHVFWLVKSNQTFIFVGRNRNISIVWKKRNFPDYSGFPEMDTGFLFYWPKTLKKYLFNPVNSRCPENSA